ncbi:MAG: hypothetical protein U5K79_00415 [Cyclobacteriaceae bacterium]|nr:hypothetical protein [Cyclobacteriaceae bacterium]
MDSKEKKSLERTNHRSNSFRVGAAECNFYGEESGTLVTGSLLGAAFSEPKRKVLLYAAEQANQQVEKVIDEQRF